MYVMNQAQLIEQNLQQYRAVQAQLKTAIAKRTDPLPPWRHDRRRRTHWDYLLHEAQLVATDFIQVCSFAYLKRLLKSSLRLHELA